MPRIKHRATAIAIGLILAILVIYNTYHLKHSAKMAEINAIQSIFSAIGPRNLSAAALVLPDESTVLLQPAKTCEGGGGDIFALFIVNSSPENRDRRNAIRTGWSSATNDNYEGPGQVKVLFFTGITENEEIPVELEEEWKEEGDLIVEDLMDSYLNLTLKVLRILKWKQNHCPLATYLIKIDDDVHLNLLKYLKQLQTYSGHEAHNLIAGYLYNETDVIRDPNSKWFVPHEAYAGDKFPKFVSGICYAFGVDTVPKIYQASLSQPLFHLEDVFLTGMIAGDGLNMKPSHIPGFVIYWSPVYSLYTSSCTFSQEYLVVHSASLENLKCWNQFNSKNFVCDSWPLFLHC